VFNLKTKKRVEFKRQWQGELSDYVTAIAWSPSHNGSPSHNMLAATSAAGEVALYIGKTFEPSVLQPADGRSIDCCAFSHDGEFLATSGQAGQVNIWQIQPTATTVVASIVCKAWVDRMAWSPTQNLLAFSVGKYVQVWDSDSGEIVVTLNFDDSSVLDLTWHPDGKRLTVAGYQGIKTWTADDWDDDPDWVPIASASLAVAWSTDGKYIASGNLDQTVTVLEWGNASPWVMQGFPGKVRQIAWSDVGAQVGTPILAAVSADGIIVWERQVDNPDAWENRLLLEHVGNVRSVQFQPNQQLLASAGADEQINLWFGANYLAQRLDGASVGFSCLAWNPEGSQLAAGGEQGELCIWSPLQRGFGRQVIASK
jgi:WD40 repeat protein